MTEAALPNGMDRATAIRMAEESIPFVARMGVTVELLEPGHVRLRAPFEGNANHFGVMYAGALFTLAEVPGGVLSVATFDMTRFFPLVKEMSVRFLRPATTDITVDSVLPPDQVNRIAAEADAHGKSEFVLDQSLTDAAGQVVMTSHGVYQLRRWPKQSVGS